MGDQEKFDAIIGHYSGDAAYVLAMVQDVQREFRYLPGEAVEYVCERLHVPVSKGYEVSTFYKALSLTRRGRHTIHVCLGTACHLRGGHHS